MTKLKKIITHSLIIILITIIFLELISAILISSKIIPERYPSYRFQNITDQFYEHHKIFGIWHKKNSNYKRDLKTTIINSANSYGAADIERSKKNTSNSKRILVLGDSFVEGRGVNQNKRYTSLLENETNKEYLNFGSAGYFGTTQYYLVYKHLANEFDHDILLIGILPDNDFLDNDIEYGKKMHTNNYRPYLIGSYPNYSLTYYNPNFSFKKFNEKEIIKAIFREFTFSYTALKYLIKKSIQKIKLNSIKSPSIPIKKLNEQKRTYSGYYDYTTTQFNLLKYTIEKIHEESNGTPIIIVTYPTISDILAYEKLGPPPLINDLKTLCSQLKIDYHDSLEYFFTSDKNWGNYYLSGLSGGHWNNYGNQTMANFLKPIINQKLNSLSKK